MKNVYQSEEWKELCPLTRADIILVAEGVKPATTTGDDIDTYFPMLKCLENLQLKYTELKFSKKDEYVLTIYKDEKIIDNLNRKLLDPNLNIKQVWRANGEAYGYEDCCITRYSNAEIQKPNEKSIDYVVFFKEMEDLKKENKNYPEALDYRISTPCSVNCEKTLKLLGTWKETLEKHDPEAAEALKSFNKDGFCVIKPKGGLIK